MADETVSLAGIDLTAEWAWRVVDFTPLYGRGTARGDDVLIPGAAGRTARPRLLESWTFALPMLIFGRNDGQTGNPASVSRRLTLGDNIDYLRDNLLAPYAGGSATATLTHTRRDGYARTAAAIGIDLALVPHDGAKGEVVRASLVLTVPAGQLTDV